MRELTFTQAFAKYGAKLANPQWAFSAIAADGALVLSCWQHKFSMPAKGVLRYTDPLSRFRDKNPAGKKAPHPGPLSPEAEARGKRGAISRKRRKRTSPCGW